MVDFIIFTIIGFVYGIAVGKIYKHNSRAEPAHGETKLSIDEVISEYLTATIMSIMAFILWLYFK